MRRYAGMPRPELLLVTVWPYDMVNLELGHDLDLQNNDLDKIDPELKNELKLLQNKLQKLKIA